MLPFGKDLKADINQRSTSIRTHDYIRQITHNGLKKGLEGVYGDSNCYTK